MPAKNFLSHSQKQNLQKAIRSDESPQVRERALMLLLMNDGKTYQQISNFLGCSPRTVVYWCVHGDPDNLETLIDKRSKGNYHKASEAYMQLLLSII